MTTADRPRISTSERHGASRLAWAIAHVGGRRYRTEPINVFLVLGRNPRVFRGWLRFAATLMPRGRLPRDETELVILRVAHLAGSGYEQRHHERIGRAAGLSGDEIARVTSDPLVPGEWTARRAALLAVADGLVRDDDVDDASWVAVREHLDEPTAIELVMLVAHYRMLAGVIRALRVPPEASRRRP